MVSATGLSYAVLSKFGASTRTPAVKVRLEVGLHSSCAYTPEYNTSSGCTGSACPGMFAYRTWKRRSVTGETVRLGLAR